MLFFLFFFSSEWIAENTVSIKILGPKLGSNGDIHEFLAIKHPGVPGLSMREMLPPGNLGKANGEQATEDRG